jgi:hypothetical protein
LRQQQRECAEEERGKRAKHDQGEHIARRLAIESKPRGQPAAPQTPALPRGIDPSCCRPRPSDRRLNRSWALVTPERMLSTTPTPALGHVVTPVVFVRRGRRGDSKFMRRSTGAGPWRMISDALGRYIQRRLTLAGGACCCSCDARCPATA